MNNENPISDEVLNLADIALSERQHWMVFNHSLYFVNKKDIHFFSNETDAIEFANNNISDRDSFYVMRFDSIQDILKKVPYGEWMNREPHDPDANGLYNRDGNAFTDALIEHIEHQQLFNSQLKTNVMNNENLKDLKHMSFEETRIKNESEFLAGFENNTINQENFKYLTDNIKYMGFGENLKAELEKNMNEGKTDFQLHYQAEINKKPFEATLNFRKSDSTDMYFFNSYHASLEKNNGDKMEQTFYLNKGKGITSKEAYNLLDGRAVRKDLVTKEGQPYSAWVQLDPNTKDKNNNFEVKQFHENYGFDLKAAVEKFPIQELKDIEKEKSLMQSLQKGNVQSVTIEKDGNSHKMFIEADPQYKKVNLYDSNMKMVNKESIEKYQSVGQAATQAVKEEVGNDKKKELKEEVKPDKEKLGKKNDKTLLPKKRESTKKGLGVS